MLPVPLQADKRAHHNALERKRRDHIKDSFHGLRDSVPALQGEKVRGKYVYFLCSITVPAKNINLLKSIVDFPVSVSVDKTK